jgi:hypothetical protein
MYVYCVYPAMSKKSENLSDLNKKDRNKHHFSPFINVVKGVFFVVRVTLVPVSYLSAPSAVHSYRVPGKFIRRLKSLFVLYEKFIRLVRIKQKFIRIAYLYSKCTDCRINIQYWSVDGKYRIYLTRLRNGVKNELLTSLSPRFAPSQINSIFTVSRPILYLSCNPRCPKKSF